MVHIISYAIACLTTICGSIIGSVLGKFKLFTSKLLEVNWSFSFKKPNSNKLLLPLHETDNNSYQLYHAAWPGRKQTASAYCVVQNTFPYTHIQAESFGQPWGQKNQWCSSSTKPSLFRLKFIVWPGCDYFQASLFCFGWETIFQLTWNLHSSAKLLPAANFDRDVSTGIKQIMRNWEEIVSLHHCLLTLERHISPWNYQTPVHQHVFLP